MAPCWDTNCVRGSTDSPVAPDLQSPDWLLAGVDAGGARFHFARVTRETYRRSAFLDHRIEPRPQEVASATAAEIDRLPHTGQPAGYVLHTAFCCSTLLARCLDHPGRTLVLREPLVLSHLAGARRERQPWAGEAARRALRLLDRAYAGERVLVKPSNFANALAPDLLTAPGRRIVLLSCGLKAFLVSVLKKREEAAARLDVFLAAALADGDLDARLEPGDWRGWPLLERAALWWHAQRHALETHRGEQSDRFLALTMERLLSEPREALGAVDAFLALGIGADALDATVEGGAFTRHAKGGEAYGADRRAEEQARLEARHADVLEAALDAARRRLERVPVPPWPGEAGVS